MILAFQPLQVPLRMDETGTVRVANTRITLDLVVVRFLEGASPEEITHSYDTLRLEAVYLVVAYYLTHKDDVHSYLKRREDEATTIRRNLEAAGVSKRNVLQELQARAVTEVPEHAVPPK